ncbi:MAG: diguanylate cyclase [Desulfobacterales bacterium]
MIRRVSITYPTIGMAVLIILSVTFSFYYIEVKALRDILMVKETTKAEDIYYIVESLIQRDSDKLVTLSKVLKEHSGLIEGLKFFVSSDGDIKPLKVVMNNLYSQIGVDICQIFDKDSKLIYGVTKGGDQNSDFSDIEMDAVLSSNDKLMAEQIGKRWALLDSVQIFSENQLYGKIMIGKWIDDDYANKIAYETEVHVSFGSTDGVIASSLPPGQRNHIDNKALENSILDIKSIRIEHAKNFKVIHYSPMELAEKLFGLIVEMDTKSSYQLLESNKNHILRLSILILIVAISLLTAVMLYTLRPLKNLKNKAKQTVRDISGEDLKERRENEIVSVIRFFDKMVKTVTNHIAERTEAENALKKHKEDLETQIEERTAELKRANTKLVHTVDELEQRTQLTLLFNQFGDLIQACDSEEETYSLLIKFCRKLFPTDSGYLSIFDRPRKVLKVVASWGDIVVDNDEFKRNACWAIRRGHIHFVQNPEIDPLCPHLQNNSEYEYLCAPMIAKGEVLGMLHLRLDPDTKNLIDEEREHIYSAKQMNIISLLEHYSSPLINLRLRETLKIQSIHDHLTGLYNRRYMRDTLEFEVRRAKRHNSTLGLIMVDVDHFKNFNDTYGHEVGDIVLRELGSFLRNNIRQEDIACRYGGEEFILILPNTSLENARARAEDFREKIEKELAINHLKKMHRITVSLGVSAFPVHGHTIEETLNAADAALYLAKTRGRNRVEVGNIYKVSVAGK